MKVEYYAENELTIEGTLNAISMQLNMLEKHLELLALWEDRIKDNSIDGNDKKNILSSNYIYYMINAGIFNVVGPILQNIIDYEGEKISEKTKERIASLVDKFQNLQKINSARISKSSNKFDKIDKSNDNEIKH